MKDETHGIPIQEFVGLRPKMYSILYTEKNGQRDKEVSNETKASTCQLQGMFVGGETDRQWLA